MKILGPGHFLGLAVGDRSIAVAEIAPKEGGVLRSAGFVLPPAVSLESPEVLGEALGAFLREHRFTASRAVIGLPARWILTRGRELPPLSPGMAAEALRIQAERDLSLPLEDLVLDFAGDPDPREARQVLVAAVLRKTLDRVVLACRSAGLRVQVVTPTALTLARAAGERFRDGMLVSLSPGAAEILVQSGGVPTSLRHLALGGEAEALPAGLAALGGEIRRLTALLPGSKDRGQLILWDGIGIGAGAAAVLVERSGLAAGEVHEHPTPSVEAGALPEAEGPAAWLARAGADRSLAAVDFLHSRCAPPRKRKLDRKTLTIASLASVLAIGALVLFIDLGSREADLSAMRERLTSMAEEIKEADTFVRNNKALVMGWYDARPRPLEMLKRVTLAFPEEGRVWAMSFTATDGRKGSLSGKATDQKSVLTVLDRLKADPSLSDVMLSDMREAGGKSGVIFALTFNYQALE